MKIDWSKKSLNEAELFFSTDLKKGLSRKYVLRNRKTYGRNIIDGDLLVPCRADVPRRTDSSRNFYEPEKKHNLKAIFSRAFDVMTLLLFALIVILTIVYKDYRLVFLSVMLFAGMANAAAVGIRTEKKFAVLYNKARPKVVVIRNGRHRNIYTEEIVPGDIILLSVGDVVPCDARIIQENSLEAHENLFGEAKISRKTAAVLPDNDGNRVKANILYASTVITWGNATCLAVSTGKYCLLAIANRQREKEKYDTPREKRLQLVQKQDLPVLQAAAQKTASFLTLAKIIFSVAVIIAGLMANKNILPFTILTLASAAAVTSDWLPLLCDYAIIIVMDKLSREGVIIKNPKTVDDLNKIDKIVINRNDTFLGNPMVLDCVYTSRDEQIYEIDAKNASATGTVLTYAYLCGEGELKTNKKLDEKYYGSGLDRAVYEALKRIGLDAAAIEQAYNYIESPRYDSAYGIKSAIVCRDTAFFLVAFGDAENIIDRCIRRVNGNYYLHNDAGSRGKLKNKANELMNRSDTVWAAAVKELKNSNLSDSPSQVYSMDFLGFVSFSPAQSFSSAMAFDQLKNSGAAPVIISESGNAAAIRFMKKHNIGSGIISGKELERFNDVILYSEIPKINMFASVNTAGKLKIINALKSRNFTVSATVRELNEIPVTDSVPVSFADMGVRGGMISNRASVICRSLSATALSDALKGATIIYGNVKNIFSLLLSFYGAQIILSLTTLFFGSGGGAVKYSAEVTRSFSSVLIWFSCLILPLFAISIANQAGMEKWTEKRRKIKKENNFLKSAVKKSFLLSSGLMLAAILSFTALALCVKEADENIIKVMIGLFYTDSGRAMMAAANFITLFSSCAFLTMSMLHNQIIFSASIFKNKIFLFTLLVNVAALIFIAAFPPVRSFFGLVIPPVSTIFLCIAFGLIPAGINELLKRTR